MRKMKESGIEWAGVIPYDWICPPLKYLTQYNTETLPESTPSEFEFDYVDIGSVSYENGIEKLQHFTFREAPSRARRVVNAGDIILSTVRTYLKATAQIPKHDDPIIVSTGFLTLKAKNGICSDFLRYAIQSENVVSMIEARSTGISYPAISASEAVRIPIPLPKLDTQKQIAAFLDTKCTQIDDLVTNVQTQIKKLKAYKQSLITEVVTRGLDPSVPMKDSGVEWIGKIPAHWEITRIKNLFVLRNERNFKPLDEVNLISLYTDLGVVQHSELTETTGNRAVNADGYKLVYERDIVVNIILCWMGAIGMSKYNGVTSPAYDVYKPKENVFSEYYHYLFRTKAFNGECYRYGRGIMMMRWRTYSTEFSAISVPLPPEDEQRTIVAYLDDRCRRVDQLIAIKQAKIDKLNEYKKSLIYEYVTGKKEA